MTQLPESVPYDPQDTKQHVVKVVQGQSYQGNVCGSELHTSRLAKQVLLHLFKVLWRSLADCMHA
eukprot:1158810-Pelagomonas_calceolata.AAC.4